jgi:2-polyprenyl-6-hydroxyphenyl methylase/3-demethylubiquinone-9 3-methyltransferase
VAEHLPGGAPPGIHDPALMVDPERLRRLLAAHGVRLGEATGLRPSVRDYLAWLLRRTDRVRMVTTGSTAGVYQALGTKEQL